MRNVFPFPPTNNFFRQIVQFIRLLFLTLCNIFFRFCLGQLSNVNRNSTIENTRRHIGKGKELIEHTV